MGDDTLLFNGANEGLGRELWATDGSSEGTRLISDIWVGEESSLGRYFTLNNGFAYFSANDGEKGPELWKTDGSNEGTHLLADLRPGEAGSFPFNLFPVDGTLYFQTLWEGTMWRLDGETEELRSLEFEPLQTNTTVLMGASEDAVYFWNRFDVAPEILAIRIYSTDPTFTSSAEVIWEMEFNVFESSLFDSQGPC